MTKRFSNHFQVFANYIWSQNKDNGASERDTDTYFGQQDPINLKIDYFRNGLDIRNQFKAAGVYELPWGFEVSSSVIAHTGVPFPLYIAQDINGDGVSNLGHNNDRPTFTNSHGKTSLLTRYPFDQPGYFEWDGRLQKDIHVHERFHVIASGDFFNLTNRGNLYSNPNSPGTATISLIGCSPRTAPPVTLRAEPGQIDFARRSRPQRCRKSASTASARLHKSRPAARPSRSRQASSSYSDELAAGEKAVFAEFGQFCCAGGRLASRGPRCRRRCFIRRRHIREFSNFALASAHRQSCP